MRDTFTQTEAEARFEEAYAATEEPAKPSGPLVLWYGDAEPEPPPYLVQGMLPQTQTAILAGQFSSGKTFIAMDLALAVMLGLDFAGRKVMRTGAVLWLAAEGASEVDVRLKAAALHRTGDDHKGKLPFCRQASGVPSLADPASFDALMAIVAETKGVLAERFDGTELALIVVDTLNSAANFEDQNSGSEAMRVWSLCRRLSDATGALVLVVDHFGKLVETGVKGSSDKSGAADAILSALADNVAGDVSNRRLKIVKLRSAPTGATIPFKLVQVAVNEWGTTSCGVEWQVETAEAAEAAKAEPKQDWTGSGRVFKAAMIHAMLDHGEKKRPFGFEGSEVKATTFAHVRTEFTKRYAADTADAKRKAFKRELTAAMGKQLVASREIDGVDWLWFAKDADAIEAQASARTTRTDTDTPL